MSQNCFGTVQHMYMHLLRGNGIMCVVVAGKGAGEGAAFDLFLLCIHTWTRVTSAKNGL